MKKFAFDKLADNSSEKAPAMDGTEYKSMILEWLAKNVSLKMIVSIFPCIQKKIVAYHVSRLTSTKNWPSEPDNAFYPVPRLQNAIENFLDSGITQGNIAILWGLQSSSKTTCVLKLLRERACRDGGATMLYVDANKYSGGKGSLLLAQEWLYGHVFGLADHSNSQLWPWICNSRDKAVLVIDHFDKLLSCSSGRGTRYGSDLNDAGRLLSLLAGEVASTDNLKVLIIADSITTSLWLRENHSNICMIGSSDEDALSLCKWAPEEAESFVRKNAQQSILEERIQCIRDNGGFCNFIVLKNVVINGRHTLDECAKQVSNVCTLWDHVVKAQRPPCTSW